MHKLGHNISIYLFLYCSWIREIGLLSEALVRARYARYKWADEQLFNVVKLSYRPNPKERMSLLFSGAAGAGWCGCWASVETSTSCKDKMGGGGSTAGTDY